MSPQQQVYAALTNAEKRRFWIQFSHHPSEFHRLERELAPLITGKAAKQWIAVWRPAVPGTGAAPGAGSGINGSGTHEG